MPQKRRKKGGKIAGKKKEGGSVVEKEREKGEIWRGKKGGKKGVKKKKKTGGADPRGSTGGRRGKEGRLREGLLSASFPLVSSSFSRPYLCRGRGKNFLGSRGEEEKASFGRP